MKKLLTLLMLTLITGVGAWAQTFTIPVSPGEGTFYRGTGTWNDTSKPWCSRFLSNDIEISEGVRTKVDISVTSPSYQNNYNHKDNNGFYVCPGAGGCTYTIRLSNTDYVVKSVTMTLNEAGGANATNIVIAGQTYARTNATTTPLTLTKVPATAFKVSGNNSFVKITDIRLEVAPFEVASDIANAKWFQLNVRGSYVVYDAESGTYHDTTSDQPSAVNPASWFTFVGSKDDFKIVNYAAGFDKAMGADNVNTNTRLNAKDYANAQSFKIEEVTYQGTNGIQIREKNNANAFLNQQGTNLGYWNYNARGDYGNLFVLNQVEGPVEGDETIIYNPNCQKYVTNTLASTSNVANAATFIKVDCGANATYSDHDYPKFKLYVEGKGWVSKAADNTDMTTKGKTKFGFSALSTNALEFIYVDNDIIPVVCIGYEESSHGQLSWNWHGGANDSNVMGLYGVTDGNCNWAFCKQYTINSTGLQNSEVGGICYNRVNYAGATAMLPAELDKSALIAMHVSGYNGSVSVDDANKTITVNYSTEATAGPTLWPDNNNSSNLPAARIPAIVKSQDYILAFSDWRYNRNDIGRGDNGKRIDIEMRRSHDNGQTWEPAIIVAQGTGVSGYEAAHGDAAVVADRESGKVLMLAASGNATDFSNSSRSNPIRIGKFFSSDNGANWEKSEVTSTIYDLFPTSVTKIFVSSGKILQGSVKKEGAANYRIYAVLCTNEGNHVIYSDDFGSTWGTLGNACTAGNEAHVTELPNGDLLLDSRAGGARYVNVYTYANKQDGMAVLGSDDSQGAWGTYGTMGIPTSSDGCNGDIDIMTAYPAGSNEAVKVVLQTSPRSGRNNVSYYYMRLPEATEGQYNVNDFVGAAKWTSGYEVFHGASAYTSIFHDEQGDVHMFFEKNTTNSTWSYNMTYEKHNISLITGGAYLDHATVPLTINYTLTDVNGATYQGSCTGVEGTAPSFTGAYGYTLTGEQWGEVVDNAVSYTATINFPFPVSSNNVSKWVNLIYMPNFDRYISYDGTNAKMRQAYKTNASNDPGTSKDQTNFIWSVTPVLGENNVFGFQIYSKGAQKYVSATGMAHQAQVTLANTPDVFQLIAPTATPASATHKNDNNGAFVKQSGDNTFSICTESATGRDYLTFWNTATSSHAGQNVAIVAAYDMQEYDALLEQVENTGSHVGQYSINEEGAAEKVAECRDNRSDMTKYYEHIATMQEMASHLVLNMPQPGHFYRLKGVATGKYLTCTNARYNNNDNVYEMAADKTTGDNVKNTILYYGTDNKLVMYGTGYGFANGMQASLDANTTFTFQADTQGAVGKYNVKGVYGTTTIYLWNYSTNLARNGSVTAQCVWEIEEVESLPVTFRKVGLGYATLYSPVALDIPSNVEAYVAKYDSEKGKLMTTPVEGVIPAETAVVLRYTGELTENTTVDFNITDENGAEQDNDLTGTYATINAGENSYVFALQSNNAGFYKYSTTEGATLAGFKAYYENTTSATRGFALDFGGVVTAVSQLSALNSNLSAIYDLAGRRVNAAQKGILIQNGNKVIR